MATEQTPTNPLAGKQALRDVHYIATIHDEPTCGDRTGPVTMNPANVGCPRCHPGVPPQETLTPSDS